MEAEFLHLYLPSSTGSVSGLYPGRIEPLIAHTGVSLFPEALVPFTVGIGPADAYILETPVIQAQQLTT
jgi:hypothetical protein